MPEDSVSYYKNLVLDLKGGLWIFRKSQKISTASNQHFLSYVKKTTGGAQISAPSRHRVNIEYASTLDLTMQAVSIHMRLIKLAKTLKGFFK